MKILTWIKSLFSKSQSVSKPKDPVDTPVVKPPPAFYDKLLTRDEYVNLSLAIFQGTVKVSPYNDKPYELLREDKPYKNRNKYIDALILRQGGSLGDAYCFTDEHEVLTDSGFVSFSKLNTQRVAQVDERMNVSFTDDFKKIEKDYNGEGFFLDSQRIKAICDAGHRFFGKFNNRVNYELKTLDHVSTVLHIPASFNINNNGCDLDDEQLKLLAAFISDGFNKDNKIEVTVSKKRKVDTLESMDYFSKYTDKKCYGRNTPMTHFKFAIPDFFNHIFEDYKILKWDFIHTLNKEQAKYFLDQYMIFDGNNKNSVYTSCKKLRDQLVYIGYIAGHAVYTSIGGESPFSGNPNYRITYGQTKHFTIEKDSIKKIQLNEKLYCVSVPNERIIVRMKDRTAFVVGNCQFGQQDKMDALALHLKIPRKYWNYPEGGGTQRVWGLVDEKYKRSFEVGPLPGCFATVEYNNSGKGHIEDVYIVLEKVFVTGNILSGWKVRTKAFNTTIDGDDSIVRDGAGAGIATRKLLKSWKQGEDTVNLKGFVDHYSIYCDAYKKFKGA